MTDIANLRELCWSRHVGVCTHCRVASTARVLVCEPSSALDWRYSGGIAQVPILFWEQPVLTQVRTLLREEIPDDLAQAAELLADCRTSAKARHTSAAHRGGGPGGVGSFSARRRGSGPGALRMAVELAAPGGALRLLVDCGPG